mgnify:CR=1 FL=1
MPSLAELLEVVRKALIMWTDVKLIFDFMQLLSNIFFDKFTLFNPSFYPTLARAPLQPYLSPLNYGIRFTIHEQTYGKVIP